jgi:hypothetical protein
MFKGKTEEEADAGSGSDGEAAAMMLIKKN